ncbi:MAG: putative toxin-antitoxin system toxin component, PIN family [Candidatus Desulforudis sp.]|nr:putative toxin-antitoxin system toxin component, PIN family [Desulforudis sp.]
MRVLLDTNVVISGLLTRGGHPSRIVDLWVEGRFTAVVCPAILEEYLTVLLRPRFRVIGSTEKRFALIHNLIGLHNTVLIHPDPSLHVDTVKNHRADNRFLECALAAEAQFLVSGDRDLPALNDFESVTICSPADFLKALPDNPPPQGP